jgi:hypothetical protein
VAVAEDVRPDLEDLADGPLGEVPPTVDLWCRVLDDDASRRVGGGAAGHRFHDPQPYPRVWGETTAAG